MPRAVIVGCSGQDGRLLWDQLAAQGFSLVGISRRDLRNHESGWRDPVDVTHRSAVRHLVDGFRPDQIYYLAAHHHSSQDERPDEAALWRASWEVHVRGFQNFLDAAKECLPSARLFYASSSRIFGQASVSPQTESTPFRPACMYGVTKASGMMLANYYRQMHRLHVSSGILFNHESPLRGPQFVSQRVVDGLAGLKTGHNDHLHIGDLDARVDWGYAPDYTHAMQLILNADTAEDFIVASGETHSVREMIEIAAEALDVAWKDRVVENNRILQRSSQQLCGDSSRLRAVTGWQPSLPFAGMVQIMARAALARQESAA